MTDPVADALRPRFAAAAREAREILAGGGTGDVQVLFGHLPKATVTVTEGHEYSNCVQRRIRTFSMSIPSVLGRPSDPDSMPSFISRTAAVHEAPGMEAAMTILKSFEDDGPQILANAIRSCIFGLLHAGISHEVLAALVVEGVATSVMDS